MAHKNGNAIFNHSCAVIQLQNLFKGDFEWQTFNQCKEMRDLKLLILHFLKVYIQFVKISESTDLEKV